MNNIYHKTFLVIFLAFFISRYVNAQVTKNILPSRQIQKSKQDKNFIPTARFLNINSSNSKNNYTGPTEINSTSSLLDPSFGSNGFVRTAITGDTVNSSAQSVALQKDGKIVVAGYSWTTSTIIPNYLFLVVRYDTNGTIDTTFGTDGKVITQFNGGVGVDKAYCLAIQQDGKIVVGGSSLNNGQGSTFAVARYDSNGILDTTFGTNGEVRTEINAYGNIDLVRAIAIQADGKIIAAGNSENVFAIVRYNVDGTLDNTFGTNGKFTLSIHGGDGTNDICRSVALQNDGKIVLGGSSYSFSSGGGDAFALARLNKNGSLDSTFGGYGTLRIPGSGEGQSLAVQADEKIIIAGYIDNGDGMGNKFAVYRYNSDGTIDATFGINGTIENKIDGGTGNDDKGLAVALQTNGKIILGGTSEDDQSHYAFAVTCYDSSGVIDSSFGSNGTIRTVINGGNETDDEATSTLIQSNGKIVLAGYSTGNVNTSLAIVRYDSSGMLDNLFGNNGIQSTKIISNFGSDVATSLAFQSDGRIVVAGYAFNRLNSSFLVVRYNSNGTVDKSFGINGGTIISINGGYGQDRAHSIAIQPDGKLIVVGESDSTNYSAFALVRLNANGSLDNTFGKDGTVLTNIDGGNYGYSVIIQSDGKILVPGSVNNAFALVRFNSNGTLDKTFGVNGIAKTYINGGSNQDYGVAITIQPDAKIVETGYSIGNGKYAIALARFDNNGALDNTFGTNGTVRTFVQGGNSYDVPNSVSVQSDGKIVVAGTSLDSVTSRYSFALARFNTDGTLDNTFGVAGTVRTVVGDSSNSTSEAYSVTVQKDGKIVAAGVIINNNSKATFCVARYNAKGKLDSTFNTTGFVSPFLDNDNGINDYGQAVAIQSNGKIVVAGFSYDFQRFDIAIARFLPGNMPYASTLKATGITDSSVNVNGIVYPFKINTNVKFLYSTKSSTYNDSLNAFPNFINGDTTTEINATLRSLTPNTTYYYVISGLNSDGKYFVSSEKSFVTLVPVPNQPEPISPDDTSGVVRNPLFKWRSSKFAESYHIEIAADSMFTSIIFDSTLTDTLLRLTNPLNADKLFYWRISANDTSGSSSFSKTSLFTTGETIEAINENNNTIPRVYTLQQNYPNPFNPTTTINYSIPKLGLVTIRVYDVLGRKVRTLVNRDETTGNYSVNFNASNLSSGIYFYQLKAGDYIQTRKMILLK